MTDYAKLLIDEALKESGWQCNFAFPVASEENKYLINLLSEVKVKTHVLEEEAFGYKEKNNKLLTHLAMVQQERTMTESVLNEQKQECDQIRHNMCLAEREIGRMQQELRQLKIQRKDVNTRIGSLENEIFVRSNELSSIKSQMDCDQQQIDIYLDACEENVHLRERLAALHNVDDSRFSMLNSEAGRLSEKRREIRRKLDTIVAKNDALHLRIAAASEQCRAENKGRREVLKVWENCVAQMVKRDGDYSTLSEQYDELSNQIRDQTRRVAETKKMSVLIQDDIKQTEKSITETNKDIWNTRCHLQQITEDMQATEEELQALQKTLERTEHDFRATIAESKQTKQSLHDTTDNYNNLLQHLENLDRTYKDIQGERFNVEQLTKMAEEQLSTDEKCQKQAFYQQQQLTAVYLKTTENLNQTNSEASTLEASLNGAYNTLKGLKKRTAEREGELISLDELIYKAQLYNQRLEQRISKLEADPLMSQEELNVKNKQIKTLQNSLDTRTRTCTTLSSMINQFINDKRICKMRARKIQSQLEQLQAQLDTAQLTMTNTKLELKKQEAAWREMLVEYNVNRHQVKRMEAKLNLWRNKVMGEETRQIQLDALEREMDVEIRTRKTKSALELRQIESRMSDARNELILRKRRLDQIRARYNITMNAITETDEDALGARMRYLLQALQERQDLKHKGDDLDAEVRRAEEELRALENTIVVMNSLNEMARGESLSKVSEEPLFAEKQAVNEKVNAAQNSLSTRRQERRRLRGTIMHSEMQLDELVTLMDVVRERCQIAAAHVDRAQRAVEDSKQRYERASKLLNQVMEKLDRFFRTNQTDIEVRLLRDFNRLIHPMYERSLRHSPECNEELLALEHKLAEAMNLRKPSIFASRYSQRQLPAKRPETSRDITSDLYQSENRSVAVVSIGEHVQLPPINERRGGQTKSGTRLPNEPDARN